MGLGSLSSIHRAKERGTAGKDAVWVVLGMELGCMSSEEDRKRRTKRGDWQKDQKF